MEQKKPAGMGKILKQERGKRRGMEEEENLGRKRDSPERASRGGAKGKMTRGVGAASSRRTSRMSFSKMPKNICQRHSGS